MLRTKISKFLFLVLASLVALPAHADILLDTGRMTIERFRHTATPLEDGRVLITGGRSAASDSGLRSAEIYDPATETFAATGDMNVGRSESSAVLLDDGRVLVVGGRGTDTFDRLDSAEIYDPATATFTLTQPMSINRANFPSLVKRDDGTVLVIGGTFEGGFGTATSRIDLFTPAADPAAATFEHVGDLVLARRDHTATRLVDGRVLVAGGFYDCCDDAKNDERVRSAEIIDLDFSARLLSEELSSNRTRWASAAGLFNGWAVVAGGGRDDSLALELFDPESETFQLTGDAAFAYFDSPTGAVLLEDLRVLMAGHGVHVYDPGTDQVTEVDADFERNVHASARLASGAVLITGGTGSDGVPKDDAYLFWPAEAGAFLVSPLADFDPYDFPISSAFDHAMVQDRPYCDDAYEGVPLIAFSGEEGVLVGDPDDPLDFGCGLLFDYQKADPEVPFLVNGTYQGTDPLGETSLNYDGHPAYDIAVPTGTPVFAPAPGKVTVVDDENEPDDRSGLNVTITHAAGYDTRYFHLSLIEVKEQEDVDAGERIAYSGDTAGDQPVSPHLHFEVRKDGVPVDPYGWRGTEADPYGVLNPGAVNEGLWLFPGGPALDVDGTCPGDLTLTVDGATPGGQVAVLGSLAAGSTAAPPPCDDVVLDLDQPRKLIVITADADGRGTATVPGVSRCDVLLQALDAGSCGKSRRFDFATLE